MRKDLFGYLPIKCFTLLYSFWDTITRGRPQIKEHFCIGNEIMRFYHNILFTFCKHYTLLFYIVPKVVIVIVMWDQFFNSHCAFLPQTFSAKLSLLVCLFIFETLFSTQEILQFWKQVKVA